MQAEIQQEKFKQLNLRYKKCHLLTQKTFKLPNEDGSHFTKDKDLMDVPATNVINMGTILQQT